MENKIIFLLQIFLLLIVSYKRINISRRIIQSPYANATTIIPTFSEKLGGAKNGDFHQRNKHYVRFRYAPPEQEDLPSF